MQKINKSADSYFIYLSPLSKGENFLTLMPAFLFRSIFVQKHPKIFFNYYIYWSNLILAYFLIAFLSFIHSKIITFTSWSHILFFHIQKYLHFTHIHTHKIKEKFHFLLYRFSLFFLNYYCLFTAKAAAATTTTFLSCVCLSCNAMSYS